MSVKRVFLFLNNWSTISHVPFVKNKNTVLQTFLGQKILDIELNMQFCPKNVGKTRAYFCTNGPQSVMCHLFENKNTRFTDIFETKLHI